MASETISVARWLFALLASNEPLRQLIGTRIFAYQVPPGTTSPYVVFHLQTASLDARVSSGRISSKLSYAVKVVSKGQDFSANEAVARQVDSLLEEASGQVAGGIIAQCFREYPLEFLETTDQGEFYAHVGGVYRIWCQGDP